MVLELTVPPRDGTCSIRFRIQCSQPDPSTHQTLQAAEEQEP